MKPTVKNANSPKAGHVDRLQVTVELEGFSGGNLNHGLRNNAEAGRGEQIVKLDCAWHQQRLGDLGSTQDPLSHQ